MKRTFNIILGQILNGFKSLFSSKHQSLVFKIPKGNHFSKGKRVIALPKNYNQFEVKFSLSPEANVYTYENPEQINKIFGFKKGYKGDKSSIMLGYNTTLNRKGEPLLKIWLYYNEEDSSFSHAPIKLKSPIYPGRFYSFKITIFDNGFWVESPLLVNGHINRYWDHNISFKYLGVVRPYFGGKEPNPESNGDITIKVELQSIDIVTKRQFLFGNNLTHEVI